MGRLRDGDGRLDLDELGSVIESATAAPATELLEDGIGRPTVAERFETAGLTPWRRRHPLATGAVGIVMAVGLVALAVRVATMPPPFDPTVVATITAVSGPDLAIKLDGPDGDVGAGWFQVDAVPAGDRVAITGIHGPGLGATDGSDQSSAYAGAIPIQGAPVWSARAIIDCRDGVTRPSEDDYHLTLRKTDRWGRSSAVEVPLPIGSSRWADTVADVCWSRLTAGSLSIAELDTRVDLVRSQVNLGIRVRSSLSVAAIVGSELEDFGSVRVGQTFRAPLAARGTIDTDVVLSILSCDGASVPRPFFPQTSTYSVVSREPGVGFGLQSAEDRRTAYVPVRFTADQTREVEAAIGRVCAGSPSVGVRSVGTPQVFALGGAYSERRFRLQLDVATSSGRASAVEVRDDPGAQSPTTAVAGVAAEGVGPVTVSWGFACQNTPAPPTVSVIVTDGRRSWPWRGTLTDSAIERAVLRACPGQSATGLAANGWPALLGVRP